MSIRRKILKYLGWILVVLLALVVVARLALAPLTSRAIVGWLEQQGLDAKLAAVDYEIYDGRFALTGLEADSGGKRVLGLDRFAIGWSWQALSDHRLQIDALSVEGLDLQIDQDEDGRLTVAGIGPPAAASNDQAAPSKPLQWSLLLKALDIGKTRVCYRQIPKIDYCSSLDEFSWQGDLSFDLAEIDADKLPLRAAGKLGLGGLEIRHNGLDRVAVAFERLGIDGIDVAGIDDIRLAGVDLRGLDLLQRELSNADETRFIEHIDEFTVSDLRLQNNAQLDIDQVRINGNATDIVKSAENRYEVNNWLDALQGAETANSSPQPAADAQTSPGKDFNFTVNRFKLQSDKPLQYRDLSLKRQFEFGVASTELTVDKLDSRKPDAPSDIVYQAKLDDQSLLKLEGTATLLAQKPSFDISGELKAMDLRRLSPLTATSIGHIVESGLLDADIKLVADKGILDSNIDLTLNKFRLQPLSPQDAEELDSKAGFPLNASLSLLRDKNDRIHLDIPITGDMANPDVSPADAINQAVTTAVTETVLNFYTPFGLVTAASGIYNLATALRFEPVVFKPGSSDLAQATGNDLGRIARMMQERPGVSLTLCPVTDSADRTELFPKTAELTPEQLQLDPGQRAELARLGEARAEEVRKYLAAQQIDSDRLVLCSPQHEEGGQLSGVQIRI